MPLWPRSLLWRTFLLVAAVILLSIIAWFQIFRVAEREPRARQVAQAIVSVVNLTRAALITSQPELRRELLLELSDREGIRVYLAEPDDRIVPPPGGPLIGRIETLIQARLGPETRMAFERNGVRGFWVSFEIADDGYWVMVPRERVERAQALQWLWWAAAALVLALAAAYLIVSRVDHPLQRLSAAAGQIGKGERPEPVPEAGPAEIATLARAFNQMSADLARLDEDRALILAGVSHDLRTPLARLRLGVEMSGDDEHLRQGMVADIDDMDRIIGQFLDFARLDAADATDPGDLAALARDVAQRYRESGHALEVSIEPVPAVRLKPLAFRRLIVNLLDNAFRYGEKDVELVLRGRGPAVELEVRDRGPGIPAAEAERLKQPFTRLESARSDKGGSGLGLAIVERIARMHGARFELLPREGGGLIARVTVPAASGA